MYGNNESCREERREIFIPTSPFPTDLLVFQIKDSVSEGQSFGVKCIFPKLSEETYPHCCTVHFVESLQLLTNKCTI